MTRTRVVVLAGALAALVFANALPLGFALDDDPVVRLNPVVTEGRLADALAGPYWRAEGGGGLLYRPLTLAAFVAEWELFGGRPAGFHLVNVLAHAAVTALVALLLFRLASPPGVAAAALAGGVLFAVHPVHVEAVANVVGLGELIAAAGFLGACLLFLARPSTAVGRAARLLGVPALYLLALGAKEVAVTLPLVLLMLALHPAGRGEEPDRHRVDRELPLFIVLAAALALYLVQRAYVLGSLTGEQLPAELVGLTAVERLWTALSLWPHYARLLLLPLDLVADYGPGVLEPRAGVGPLVVAGGLTLASLSALAVATARRAPLVSLGTAWFLVTVLPVAHLGVHAGVMLAERTLYLPSVGLAIAAGGGAVAVLGSRLAARRPRALLAGAALVVVLLGARTVTRTPVWESTLVLFTELAGDHPESHRALRLYGDMLHRSGDLDGAGRAFAEAARIHPHRYPVLLEAGAIFKEAGDLDRATSFLERAVEADPLQRSAYRLLAETHLRAGDGRSAHRVAVRGLARAGPDRALWALLSESYLARGDLTAAARARRAALGLDPSSVPDWERLAVILRSAGDTAGADRAAGRARALSAGADGPGGAG